MAIWGSVLKKMDENTMILIFGEFGSSVYIFCDQVHIIVSYGPLNQIVFCMV